MYSIGGDEWCDVIARAGHSKVQKFYSYDFMNGGVMGKVGLIIKPTFNNYIIMSIIVYKWFIFKIGVRPAALVQSSAAHRGKGEGLARVRKPDEFQHPLVHPLWKSCPENHVRVERSPVQHSGSKRELSD